MKLCFYLNCPFFFFLEDWHDICAEKPEQSQRAISPSHHHCCYFQWSTLFLLQCSWRHYATVIQYLSVTSNYITTLSILPKSHVELLQLIPNPQFLSAFFKILRSRNKKVIWGVQTSGLLWIIHSLNGYVVTHNHCSFFLTIIRYE